jgi:hypothetical protein
MSDKDNNPLIKDEHKISKFGFKIWCDTCNFKFCDTRKLYTSKWEETGVFE